jgi:aminodeoxyfutalosine deaminase
MEEVTQVLEALAPGRCRAGLSPHAPYSTTPRLLKLCAEKARRRNLLLTMHVAESRQEFQMFMEAAGSMYNWIQKSDRDMSDCGLGSPVQHLERHGLLNSHFLAVHMNYLAPGDASLLGRRGVSVVHCPTSHAFFGHDPFPVAELEEEHVNICLGTDSLATQKVVRGRKPELNMFNEIKIFKTARPDFSSEKILRMATLNAARALGVSGLAGEISTGSWADLITVPFTGQTSEIYDTLVQGLTSVSSMMIGGTWTNHSGTAL